MVADETRRAQHTDTLTLCTRSSIKWLFFTFPASRSPCDNHAGGQTRRHNLLAFCTAEILMATNARCHTRAPCTHESTPFAGVDAHLPMRCASHIHGLKLGAQRAFHGQFLRRSIPCEICIALSLPPYTRPSRRRRRANDDANIAPTSHGRNCARELFFTTSERGKIARRKTRVTAVSV